MPSTCPNCTKILTGVTDASFCMYCGHRLRPDPDQTVDVPTSAYTPAETVSQAHTDNLPQTIGGYRLIRCLGSGGMGTVYEAEAKDNGNRVAIKLLSPQLAANPLSIERFKQEGRLASQISHPRCVFVYGADTDGGWPYIVMELMPGTTLKDLVDRRGTLPVGEALARILDVIDGLIETHRLGMIHRDVKPSNCFLTADDRVKIGDFGLSKSLATSQGDMQLTGTGTFLGTVLFASPEQIRGEDVGYDTDVYSVAATLYYLLVGQAPYQHQSLTAALAKAISEPPPRIRTQRPDVPRSLERVILRGLERDRSRRWDTLEEFRDALADHLPVKQVPARPRALIAAYLIDLMLVLLLVHIPIEIGDVLVGGKWFHHLIAFGLFDLIGLTLATAYFAMLEGIYGTTVGKFLLRLRVVRGGQIGPPGLQAAIIRAVVFSLLFWIATITLPLWLVEIPYFGGFLGLAAFASGAYGLSLQWRASRNFRGLHDTASGCQVVVRPRPAHRVRLSVRNGHVLNQTLPTNFSLPSMVGGFVVHGKLIGSPGHEMVWAAEDESLARRIFLWLRPVNTVTDCYTPPAAARPTRLRTLSTGEIEWNQQNYFWIAFVAPTGTALLDAIDADHPLSWVDAQYIIEQLVDEMVLANRDGTLPARLGVDQIWVEPSGRIHLLDFYLPANIPAPPPVNNPLDLIRQVTTLLLEGKARSTGGRVAAPLPPYASRITDRLFDPNTPFDDLQSFQQALAECHTLPAQATPGMRAAQVGLMASLAGPGLALMFITALAYHLWAGLYLAEQANQADLVRVGLANTQIREQWSNDPIISDALSSNNVDETAAHLEKLINTLRYEIDKRKQKLTRPERHILEWLEQFDKQSADPSELRLEQVRTSIIFAEIYQETGQLPLVAREIIFGILGFMMLLCVVAFVGFAFVFRGGLSYLLSGLALVRHDGRPAGRFRCAIRELFIWTPVIAALSVAVLVQFKWPDWGFGRAMVSAGCLGLLGAYVLLAVRFPQQGLHDKIVGTYVVPA
jgi:uncharacterized RDD family membrane protein YckC